MGAELERAAETGKIADQTSNTIKMTQSEHGTLSGRCASLGGFLLITDWNSVTALPTRDHCS